MEATYPGTVNHVWDTDRINAASAIVYRCHRVVLPTSGQRRWVVIDASGEFHNEATEWLVYLLEDTDCSPNTVKSYGPKVAQYLTWLAGHGLSWREPSLTLLAQWKATVSRMPVRTGRRKGLAVEPSTVSIYLAALLSFYRWAGATQRVDAVLVGRFFEWQQVGPNRGGGERRTERLVRHSELAVSVPEKGPTWIETREEMDAILSVPMNQRDWFLTALMFATGARVGECLSLFRSDMHLTASSVALGCGKAGPHMHVGPNETLNGERSKDRRGRLVPLPAWLVTAYADYQHERAQVLDAGDLNPHVFVNLHGQHRGAALRYDTVRDLFERISRSVGKELTPHVLRHTRASWWLHGIDCDKQDPRTVQELLGHASLSSTNVYTHTTDKALRAAVEAVAPRVRGAQDGAAS